MRFGYTANLRIPRPGTAMNIQIVPAAASDQALIGNLLELYMHDLSEVFSLEIGADGRYGYERLPLYWSKPESHHPFLLRSADRTVGFALVTRGSPAGEPDDLDLNEFFVLRAHRRGGIGQLAAFMLWNHLPGQWVVRVAERNTPALAFWENTVRHYTHGEYRRKEHPGKAQMFRVFTFRSANAAHR